MTGQRPVSSAAALNALAGFDLQHGRLAEARQQYQAALDLSGDAPELVGEIEQNLGVIASIQGDYGAARGHFQRALVACAKNRDLRGCALAYRNLGRSHAGECDWDEAGRRYHLGRQLAKAAGDIRLEGLMVLSHAEVHLALRQYDDARASAEAALAILTRVDAECDCAGAHRVLGAVGRDVGRFDVAEFHITTAVKMAQRADCPLEEAGATREMARLRRVQGRRDESLALLRRARELFARLGARPNVAEVDGELAA